MSLLGSNDSTGHSKAVGRIRSTRRFEVEDIALLGEIHRQFDFLAGTPWDDLKGSFLNLPRWFRLDLDPGSAEYERQQHRLWAIVTGITRPYDPAIDEKEPPLSGVDALRFPAHFARRDPQAVENSAEHILATGMLLKHSGLKPGQWALEYGAGFAQTALHFSRLGVNVDTVDISQEYCRHVENQASFYGVPLTPYVGRFGWNPRGERTYDLIWFYESFHHCVDFKDVVPQLKRHLATTGRLLLAGEPVRRRADECIPYPWGLRLDSENIAVIRLRHWFEIGFCEDFLVDLFTNAGFAAGRMDCPVSSHGKGYIFHHRPNVLEMATHWLPTVQGESWYHPEAEGRWTTGNSFIALDATSSFTGLAVEVTNHHPEATSLELHYGRTTVTATIPARQRRTIEVDARDKSGRLIFRSPVQVPSRDYKRGIADNRALGIYVNAIRYA